MPETLDDAFKREKISRGSRSRQRRWITRQEENVNQDFKVEITWQIPERIRQSV